MTGDLYSFQHCKAKWSRISSRQEAGYEAASLLLQEGCPNLQMHKNPEVLRGQDPELLLLQKYRLFDYRVILHEDVRSLYRHRFSRIRLWTS
jgi:hypothetical protein